MKILLTLAICLSTFFGNNCKEIDSDAILISYGRKNFVPKSIEFELKSRNKTDYSNYLKSKTSLSVKLNSSDSSVIYAPILTKIDFKSLKKNIGKEIIVKLIQITDSKTGKKYFFIKEFKMR